MELCDLHSDGLPAARHSAMEFRDLGLGSEHVDYQATWDLQRAVHAEVSDGVRPDTVLLLEHASVYTAGKRTEPHERPVDGTPVIDVDRGGKITWHGPGQLVGYPIVRLPESVLVVDYVRRLEEALITMLASYGLKTGRIRGRSGVWLAGDDQRLERKIAAIGVRVAAGTTMHGFALNVDPDLRSFDRIIPCGLTGVGVTSMTAELGRHVTVSEAAQLLRVHLQHYLAFEEYTQSPDVGSAPRPLTPGLQLAPPDPPTSNVAARRRTVVGPPAVDYAIEAYSLEKVYRTRNGKQAAVDGLDLRVPVGGVHGFLGPNGSGKTTTIRMLLGLIAADAGHIRIFDHEVPLALDQIIDRVGAIVEQPKFFPAFSGEKNLRLLSRAIGAPQRRVAAVLDEVGLARRGSDKFRKYSLGMKQRLAIAATLLKNPDLLIFDEPTNGLDPAGIHEIRSMMRNLARRGKTVLVSSHILSEVQQIADTVTIIGRGRLLAEGNVSQILSADGQLSARVGVSDHLRAAEVLTRSGFTVEPLAGRLLKVSLSNQRLDLAVITRLLADQGLYVSELTPIQPDLESVFLNLTAGDHLGAQQQRGRKPQQRRTR